MKQYLIGIDIGTQGTKAALFAQDMSQIATAFEASKLISPEPGTVWQEADDIYLSVARTIRELLEKTNVDPADIAAIGMDSQMAGIMGVDADGEASTYYDSWLDMRSRGYVDIMLERAGDRMVASSGGQVTCNHASKILWWKNEHPDVYAKTAKYVLPHAYVAGKMAGLRGENAYADYTCIHFNSFSDNPGKGWNGELLKLFDVDPDKMPRVVSPFEVIGNVAPAFAELSGLISGIPVVAGAGDSAASTFGSGMFHQDMVQDCAGTASIMCCVVDRFVPDVKYKTLTMMRSPVDGLYLPLAYINGGGLCLRWFRDTLTGDAAMSYDALEAEAEKIAAGCDGLRFCPHCSGRVLPVDATLKGGYVGLDLMHTRAHMYRAIMEGIAFEYQYYLQVIRENYPERHFADMISIGGGAACALFNQIKADVLGVNVQTFETGETALIGSAVIAGVGVGLLSDYNEPIARAMRKKNTYVPNAENEALYRTYGAQYRRMLDALSAFHKAL